MVSGIRTESVLLTSLGNLYLWLAENQGGQVEMRWLRPIVGRDVRLQVGLPITAPRAVVCSIGLVDSECTTPLLAGRLRALVNPMDGSVRIGFDGKVAVELTRGEPSTSARLMAKGREVAGHLIDMIAAACEQPGSSRLTA